MKMLFNLVCVYMCACMRERERLVHMHEKERETETDRDRQRGCMYGYVWRPEEDIGCPALSLSVLSL